MPVLSPSLKGPCMLSSCPSATAGRAACPGQPTRPRGRRETVEQNPAEPNLGQPALSLHRSFLALPSICDCHAGF